MIRIDFNTGWTCRPLSRPGDAIPVTIPHDAMRTEERTALSCGEGNIGWFSGGDYEYRKVFRLPAEAKGKHLEMEFEGVYHDPVITVNGQKVDAPPYGYTDFAIPLDGLLFFDRENEITVIAHNADQPNSRWYSGTGIYRPVWLWCGGEKRILRNGIRLSTLSYDPPRVRLDLEAAGDGIADISILDGDRRLIKHSVMLSNGHGRIETEVPGARLWNPEDPQLYTLSVSFGEDTANTSFGIRTLTWDAVKGLAINGKRTVLRGACIHHDNGLLGAVTCPEAEARRVRILKEAGYNAVRSAHNPASRYLLEACDRQGMLMMDEYVDCWYMHKTEHDYASHVMQWWKRDLVSMVEKDYNHPCVIMYSTGNEVAESAREEGIRLQQDFTAFLHEIDSTRPVTCGINIFFNFLSSIGMGVYSDEKAKKHAENAEKQAKAAAEKPKNKKKSVGSEFFNNMAAKLGTDFMKFGAWLPPCDWKTREVFSAMDIAGYNYGNWRYRKDLRKYPERLILGSETLIGDARSFWQLAKDHPRIIGDFVWAGWDYIGECGGDSPEYGSYRTDRKEDRIRGGTCRIDVTGKLTPESDYTRVCFDLEAGPRLAVDPPCEEESPVLTGWQLTRAIRSWSFPGSEGRTARVEVYTSYPRVRLTLNGRMIGIQRVRSDCRTVFRVPYEPGELKAEALDESGHEAGCDTLTSASGDTCLSLTSESAACHPGEMVYLRIRYTDPSGEIKPTEKHTVCIEAENAEVMGSANGCTFFHGNYSQSQVPTYFGEAQTVVRAGVNGPIRVRVTDGELNAEAEIICKE